MSKSLKEILRNPLQLFMTLGHRELLNWIDDETYLRIAYFICMKKRLNLDAPKSFNEKLQWLKLYDRRPEYTMMVDKCEAKKWAAERIGGERIIPTLGVWERFDDIEFAMLPNRFVLKCTHDSGGLIICRDKDSFNKEAARKKIEKCLKHSFFWGQREWPYKNVKPRIIAEPYMEDMKTNDLRDYKFFCFEGEVKAMFVATERELREEETKFDFFDADFNHLDFTNGHPNAAVTPHKPDGFEEMKTIAGCLSAEIPAVRVDLYECNGKVFFGEMTFYHWSGFVPFKPEEWDRIFGSWIRLPKC